MDLELKLFGAKWRGWYSDGEEWKILRVEETECTSWDGFAAADRSFAHHRSIVVVVVLQRRWEMVERERETYAREGWGWRLPFFPRIGSPKSWPRPKWIGPTTHLSPLYWITKGPEKADSLFYLTEISCFLKYLWAKRSELLKNMAEDDIYER